MPSEIDITKPQPGDTIDSAEMREFATIVKSEIEALQDGKVDKTTGKGLSTNDFSNELKTSYNSHLANNSDAHGFLAAIRDNVVSAGDTLAKLYSKFSDYTPTNGLTSAIYASVFNALSATNADVANGDTLTQVINKIIGKLLAVEARAASAFTFHGGWDASTGVFPTGAMNGYVYSISVGGTVNGIEFNTTDRLTALIDNPSTTVYAGNWLIEDYSDKVSSVNGQVGAVTGLMEAANFTASAIKTLLGIATLSGSNTGDQDLSGYQAKNTYGNIETMAFAISDETTAITTGTAKITFHILYDFNITKIKAGVSIESTSGLLAFNVKANGTSVFSTALTIDENERFSDTAATAAVLSGGVPKAVTKGTLMTVDIDTAGTGAIGAKIYIIGYATGAA